MPEFFEEQPVVYTPDPTAVADSRLGVFCRRHGLTGLDALRERAALDPEWFWRAVMDDIGWPFPTPYRQVLDVSAGWQWAKWFVGGETNVALAALDRHAAGELANKTAVVYEGEDGTVQRWTYGGLREAVDRLAWGLERLGVGVGDVVGVYLPMLGETVIALLALAKVGAVFLPVFSGYGAEAMAARLADAGAAVLITADGFTRRGRRIDMKAVADEAVRGVPSVRRVVVVSRVGEQSNWAPERDIRWEDLLAEAGPEPYPTRLLATETPLLLIYTSGTTGRPKGTVHTHTGFPLKATQDLWHAFDLRQDDVFFWYTDMGWMMGPWMVYGGLITGATIVMYDGTPDFPSPSRLWEIIDRHRVTLFGISPTAVRSLMAHGAEPLATSKRTSLRILGSSGETWNPGPWQWFSRK
ncbi:MAG: AMP-binding protein [Thermaerobacter sp.]|nr:AMP-binding protein [Thermaerobacter sp.]